MNKAIIMELPGYIVENAKKLVALSIEGGITLPTFIPDSPEYYVAKEADDSILGFGGFEWEDGAIYKIGTKK